MIEDRFNPKVNATMNLTINIHPSNLIMDETPDIQIPDDTAVGSVVTSVEWKDGWKCPYLTILSQFKVSSFDIGP